MTGAGERLQRQSRLQTKLGSRKSLVLTLTCVLSHCRVQVRKQLRKVTHGDRLPGRWSLPGVGLGQVVCVRVDQVDGEEPRPCGACRALQDNILVNTLQRRRPGPCHHPKALVPRRPSCQKVTGLTRPHEPLPGFRMHLP